MGARRWQHYVWHLRIVAGTNLIHACKRPTACCTKHQCINAAPRDVPRRPCSIRAAHCLTSVQFSPCCQHILLAYGKKHISLLRSLVADRGSVVPLHTILEVFRWAPSAAHFSGRTRVPFGPSVSFLLPD